MYIKHHTKISRWYLLVEILKIDIKYTRVPHKNPATRQFILSARLETDMITIPHANSNLYSVPNFIVFKIQKDLSTRTEGVAREQFCLQTDDGNDI
jgi:hypothetical protein